MGIYTSDEVLSWTAVYFVRLDIFEISLIKFRNRGKDCTLSDAESTAYSVYRDTPKYLPYFTHSYKTKVNYTSQLSISF